jgi:putative FmdB family regulatory protein
MATYQYECSKCRKYFSVDMNFREFDRHRPVKCPQCKGATVTRVYTAAHVQTAKKS